MKPIIKKIKSHRKMKNSFTLYFSIFILFLSTFSFSQTITENYIVSTEYLTDQGENGAKKTSLMYFDGLGREKQALQVNASPSGKTVVVHYAYDEFGRPKKEYMPSPTSQTGANIIPSAEGITQQYYQSTYGQNTYFSEKEYEASPLNRIMKQASPGDAWNLGSGHEVKFDYQTNTSVDAVILFKAETSWNASTKIYDISLTGSDTYETGQLYKTVTKDENWQASDANNNTVEEFKDKEGKVILKRTYNNGAKHDTYYVYDMYGNLTYVLPPKLSDYAEIALINTYLDDLGYQYKYDNRNRLAEKKLPGKDWEYMVYDKQDRLVLTQDGNQRGKQWIFTKYDKFSRVVYTGLFTNTATRVSMQTALNNMSANAGNNESRARTPFTLNGLGVYYTKVAFPTGSMTILTVNYYDTYPEDAPLAPTSVEGQNILSGTGLTSLPLASYAQIIDASQTTTWNKTYTYYDTKARPVRVLTNNYLGGFTQTDSKLDFRGKPEYTITTHSRATQNTEITLREAFTYDSQERLLTHTHQTNNGTIEYLTQNEYDELGKLKNKKVGGTNQGQGLQQVDYSYNIRGWLTAINDITNLSQTTQPNDLFSFKINYNTVETNTSDNNIKPLYNGNIAETQWRTSSDNIKRSYGYIYDNLNRLNSAIYSKNEAITNAYNESLTYDKNGNIQNLVRNGVNDDTTYGQTIDNLSYTYDNGNKLLSVTDNSNDNVNGFKDLNTSGNDYTYDVNGNMTSDKNKDITSITYNYLNLPVKILFANDGYIEYLYTATGEKVMKKVYTPGTMFSRQKINITNYLNSFQYAGVGITLSELVINLQFFPTAEGYYNNANNSYVYNYTDHLGNVRLSYSDVNKNGIIADFEEYIHLTDPNCIPSPEAPCVGTSYWTVTEEILEENNYYPFGMKHSGYNNIDNQAYNYKYNGKELQDELGLNVYDYGARMYMPDIGRWGVVDPLAEKSRKHSPYVYALNNPIYFIDPDGMEGEHYNWHNKRYEDNKGNEVGFEQTMASHESNTNDDPPTRASNGTDDYYYDSDNNIQYKGGTQGNWYVAGADEATILANPEKKYSLPSSVRKAYANAQASGEYGLYSPYKNDAFSINGNIEVNAIFFRVSGSIGIAVGDGDGAFLFSGDYGFGVQKGLPGFKSGVDIAFTDKYGEGTGHVLDELGGTDIKISGSAVFGGYYSQSADVKKGIPDGYARKGAKTIGINLGIGIGADVRTSHTKVYRFSQLFK